MATDWQSTTENSARKRIGSSEMLAFPFMSKHNSFYKKLPESASWEAAGESESEF